MARIVDQVRERGVPDVFGSEVFPSGVLEQIADETGARYEDTLRDDDLPGEPGDAEHSWLGLMRYDYVTMITGLGGTAKALEALDVADVVDRPTRRTRSDRPRSARSIALERRELRLRRRGRCCATSTTPSAPAAFTGIVGPSGSGKTSLLKLLLGTVAGPARHGDPRGPGSPSRTCRSSRPSTGTSR